METVTDFILGGSKITADGYCSHEIKRCLLLGRKAMTNLKVKVKEESENVCLKFNIQKTKIMASGPITSWQIDRETMETMREFILGGSKITADCDCSHEIKRCLLLEKKALNNLDSI